MLSIDNTTVTVSALCYRAKISRQGYYQQTRARQRRSLQAEAILRLVRRIRQRHHRMGTRKLWVKVVAAGYRIGRDRLFSLLRSAGLLIPRRRRFQRTTDSCHRFRLYPNLIRDREVTRPHQVWASDLTYLRTNEGFVYLALITDMGSRKIVGYSVHGSLEVDGALSALRMALAQRPEGCDVIHHSDRGSQYCCGDYTGLLHRHGLEISMTEMNHCYENALAERVNGILKHEYGLKECFESKAQARLACRQAIRLYNEERPHLALGMRTPEAVHTMAA